MQKGGYAVKFKRKHESVQGELSAAPTLEQRLQSWCNPDTLFFLAYGIFLVARILSTTFFYSYYMGTPEKYIRYAWIGLLAIRELLKRDLDWRGLAWGAIFAVFAVMTKHFTGTFAVAYILIFVFCARNVELERIARFTVYVMSAVLVVVVICSLACVIDNYVYTSSTRVRYCLGFRYSLYAPAFLFNITGLYLYVERDRLRWWNLLLLLVANTGLFIQSQSRLSYVLSVVLLVVFALYRYRPALIAERHRLFERLVWSFVICFVVCCLLTAIYTREIGWMKELNTLLGNRLKLGHNSLLENGVPLFGQVLEQIGHGLDAFGDTAVGQYNYVDCYYIKILQRYGILFTAFWLGVLTWTMYRLWRLRDYMLMLCMVMVAMHCAIDDLQLNLYYNTFWLTTAVLVRRPQALPVAEEGLGARVGQLAARVDALVAEERIQKHRRRLAAMVRRMEEDPDFLFFLALGVYLAAAMLRASFYYQYFIGSPEKLIRYVWFALLLLRELLKRDFTRKSLLWGGVFAVFALTTRLFSDNYSISFILIFVFCARNVDFERIAKFAAAVLGVMLVFVMVSAFLGIIQNYTFVDGTRFRQNLGFRMTSAAPAAMFNISALLLFAHRKRLKWRLILVLLAANTLICTLSMTRLPYGMALILIGAFAVYRLCPGLIEHRRRLTALMIACFAVGFTLSLLLVVFYTDDIGWMYTLNIAISHRLSLAQTSLQEYGVTLLGQPLTLIGNGLDAYGEKVEGIYNYVDCVYIQTLQRYGVVYTLFWVGLMTRMQQHLWKKREYMLMVCLAIWAMHGIIDDRTLHLEYNTLWLAVSMLLSRSEAEPEEVTPALEASSTGNQSTQTI